MSEEAIASATLPQDYVVRTTPLSCWQTLSRGLDSSPSELKWEMSDTMSRAKQPIELKLTVGR